MRALVLVPIGVMGSFVGSVQAQTGDVDDETSFVEGHVFDGGAGAPTSGALVVLPDRNAQAQTVDVDDQTSFIEGHVFDRRTGVPISGALVVLPDPCFICTTIPVPVQIITDENGFFATTYRPRPSSAGITIPITASCVGERGVYSGEIEAILRPGTIRRDIYLRVPERISRCRTTEATR